MKFPWLDLLTWKLTVECCCLQNGLCRNEAARQQVTQLYYQQIQTTWDDMGDLDLSSCWCMEGGKTADKFYASQTAAWHNTAQAPSSCGVSAQQWLLFIHGAASQIKGLCLCQDKVSQGKQSCMSLPGEWLPYGGKCALGLLCFPRACIHSQKFYGRFMLS